jgi:hypothetical protein
MKVWHPWPLKKSKSWGPFWNYQLNSTANPAHLPHKVGQMGCLAGSSKTAPRILIFSIAIGADYSFDIKSGFSIAPTFSLHNNFDIASVMNQYFNKILSLFLTEVGFETSEGKQLSYFQNVYFSTIL